MTYVMRRRPVRRRPRSAMSGILDTILGLPSGTIDLVQQEQDRQCLDQANQLTAGFDAKIDDLVKNWQPTGFYTPDDIRTLVSQTLTAVQSAQATVNQGAAEPSAAQDSLMRATDDLGRAGSRSLDYLQAATVAEQQGLRVVNAPGLKRWVTDTLGSASSAVVTVSVIGCMKPWWVDALATFQAAFDKVWAVVKQFVGAVLKLGELTLKVPDALDEMLTILKWSLGIGGAAWVFHEIHVRRGGRPWW